MNLTVLIKEEIKEEALDDTETPLIAPDYQEAALHLNFPLDQPVKEELLSGEGCIEAEVSKQLPQNDSSLVSGSGDDCDRMPSDWFSGATSDSEESTVDASGITVCNFPIKEERSDAESLTTFASTQPAAPSIIVKDETCPCGEDCLDCLETEQSDSDETIVDAPVTNVSAAPVSNSSATTSSRSNACPECGKTFGSNSKLKAHQRVHTGERPYVCAQCPKAFKQLGDLTRHQLTHQAVRSRPFKCTAEGCGKDFTTKQHLTIHLKVHTGERPYVCTVCPKAYTQLGALKEHQLTHQAVRIRPFKCTAEGCGKAFTRKGKLEIHLGSHTGDKPYKCEICGKGFTRNGSLTVHLRTHKGEKKYKCDACGKAFTTSSELTLHFRTHTGERPYQCPLCPKAFTQSSAAKTHQRTAHPTEL